MNGKIVNLFLVLMVALMFCVNNLNLAMALEWQIETVDSEGDVGLYTSIALDSSDHKHISYYDSTNGDLKYASFDGSSWHIETVDGEGDLGSNTSISLDSSDHPHISYYDVTNGDLKYAYFDGSSWQIETVDSEGNVAHHTSISLDSSDYPHISYYDLTNKIMLGKFYQIQAGVFQAVQKMVI